MKEKNTLRGKVIPRFLFFACGVLLGAIVIEISSTFNSIKPATLAALAAVIVALLAVICTYKANDISERTLDFLRQQWLFSPSPQLTVELVDKEKNGGLVLKIINFGNREITPIMIVLYLASKKTVEKVRLKEKHFQNEKGTRTFNLIKGDYGRGEFFLTEPGVVKEIAKKLELLKEEGKEIIIRGGIQLSSSELFPSSNYLISSKLKSIKESALATADHPDQSPE